MESWQPPILSHLRASVSRLKGVLSSHPFYGRTALARRVCEVFGFYTATGDLRTASCLQALRVLNGEGKIMLPSSTPRPDHAKARLLSEPVPSPTGVPERIEDLAELRIELVQTREELAVWNTLMDQEHPQGVTKFAGVQKKYLFNSAHGYLGGIGFAASALYLAAREAWIGWSSAQRDQYRSHMIGLNRFLIRPDIRCKNLASYLLSRSLRQMRADVYETHACRIWVVETFVDAPYSGTCFVAAGFHRVGETLGRGRHAPTNACTRSKKGVFLYEFSSGWRTELGLSPAPIYPILEIGAGLDANQWAVQEFGAADLGHKSRTDRLVKSADLLSRSPGAPITANLEMDRAAVSGHYRFIDHPDREAVSPERILAPHRARTVERMRGEQTVLCLIDETKISYSTRPSCAGLEVIGRNQTDSKSGGVRLHTTLAVTDQGLPLGVLRCGYGPSDPSGAHPNRQRWIDAVEDVVACAKGIRRSTRMVVVIDREGDSAHVMERCLRGQRVEVLVRAQHERNLPNGKKLFAWLHQRKAAGRIEVPIERLSQRSKSGRVLHKGREGRIACMEVRFVSVELSWGPMTAIEVRELHRGSDALKWILLTSLPVTTFEEAQTVVGYYLQRWRAEDLFRVLKSGCKAEELRMNPAVKLHRAVTIYTVIAWRLLLLTLLGREVPNMSADILFTETQLRILRSLAAEHELPGPNDLAAAILLVACLGGYQQGKKRPPPGVEVMWRGYRRLEVGAMCVSLDLKHQNRAPPESP